MWILLNNVSIITALDREMEISPRSKRILLDTSNGQINNIRKKVDTICFQNIDFTAKMLWNILSHSNVQGIINLDADRKQSYFQE